MGKDLVAKILSYAYYKEQIPDGIDIVHEDLHDLQPYLWSFARIANAEVIPQDLFEKFTTVEKLKILLERNENFHIHRPHGACMIRVNLGPNEFDGWVNSSGTYRCEIIRNDVVFHTGMWKHRNPLDQLQEISQCNNDLLCNKETTLE